MLAPQGLQCQQEALTLSETGKRQPFLPEPVMSRAAASQQQKQRQASPRPNTACHVIGRLK